MQEVWLALSERIQTMLPAEMAAVGFCLIYVILAAKRNIWCWPAGFIGSALYVYLCWIGQLYVETILQTFYVVMAIYGWFNWKAASTQTTLPIKTLTLKQHFQLLTFGVITASAVGYAFINYTNAAIPYLDSFTTIFSFIGTWMVARRILENWLYWIVIDIASIFLYASREYYLTSGLYILYTIIAVFGYIAWKQSYQNQSESLWSAQNPVAKPA